MIVTREEMKAIRLQLVHEMHDYIMNTGDEEIYDVWFTNYIPEDAEEEDFEFFTDAKEFNFLCKGFGSLVYRDEKENY